MIYVIAKLTVAEGKRDTLLGLFRRLVPQVHAEEGCIEYGVAVDVKSVLDVQEMAGKDTVVVIEKWVDVTALKRHLAEPHIKEFLKDTEGIVINLSIQVLEPAS